jgi:lipid II:glycine glycyltransferase (peptidoglycan interpeptide bridge formation enzyme)
VPITTVSQLEEWDRFATRSPVAHIQQCRWWATPLEDIGVTSHIVGVWKSNKLIGGALFRSVPIPFVKMSITECLSGPIFLEWSPQWADVFIHEIQKLAKKANSMTVSIQGCRDKDIHEDFVQAFDRQRLRVKMAPGVLEAVMSLQGHAIKDLWRNFKTLTKRSVKKGLSGPIHVKRLTEPHELMKAYETWMATARRQRFSRIRSWPTVEPVLRHAVESGVGRVFGTCLDDKILASIFVTYIGDSACYVYGGYMDGAECHRPTHVLQYVAIQEAIDRKMSVYTFGELNEESSWTGVDKFKLGFGAVPQRQLETITWERKPLWHQAIQWLRRQGIGHALETLLMRQRGAYAKP